MTPPTGTAALQRGSAVADVEPRHISAAAGGPWVLALDAWSADPVTRSDIAAGLATARVDRFGWLVLRTCRRVELLGAGPRPSPDTLVALTGMAAAAHARVAVGQDAVRHVLRLAAGLESVVIGEDQVLSQVRRLRRTADTTPAVDRRLVGLLDLAIQVGRRARAEQPRGERSLADRALAWLQVRLGSLAGARVLVVGGGPIGLEACRLVKRAGASLTVVSRRVGGPGRLGLDGAAAELASADAVVVALAGPWSELLDVPLAGSGRPLPHVVDLSSPPAVPGPVRARLGGHLVTLDDVSRTGPTADARAARYVEHAELLVAEALERHERRADARLAAAIRDLRGASEARRRRDLDDLFGRLPGLDARERAAIERFSRGLVNGVLHVPTLALRDGA